MAKKWPEQRWSRKWSEIIESLIRSLIGPAHVPELGQDRPAQGAQRETHRSESGHGLATKVNKGAEKAMRKPHEASESRHAASA